jgi:hypothetical protein
MRMTNSASRPMFGVRKVFCSIRVTYKFIICNIWYSKAHKKLKNTIDIELVDLSGNFLKNVH